MQVKEKNFESEAECNRLLCRHTRTNSIGLGSGSRGAHIEMQLHSNFAFFFAFLWQKREANGEKYLKFIGAGECVVVSKVIGAEQIAHRARVAAR